MQNPERLNINASVFKKEKPQEPPSILELYPEIRELHEQGKLKGLSCLLIPDGNATWAEENNVSTFEGHQAGGKAIVQVVKQCRDLEMDFFIWVASPNNLTKRPKQEVKGIHKVTRTNFKDLVQEAELQKGRIIHIGEKSGLPLRLKFDLWKAEYKTRKNTGPIMGVAINYDQRGQLIRIAKKANRDKRHTDYSTPGKLESMYYGDGSIRGVNIIMRTSGHKRLSGLSLPFTDDKTELFFIEDHCPDLTVEHVRDTLVEYFGARKIKGGGRPTHK